MKYLASIVIVLLIAACGPSAEQQRAAAQAAAAAKAEREAAAQAVLYQRNLDAGETELAAAYGELVIARYPHTQAAQQIARSEERRVGQAWVRPGRYRWSP